MRQMLLSSPSFDQMGTNLASLDEVTCWVLTENGMRIAIKRDAAAMDLRRSGNTYYTDNFLKLLLAWSLDTQTKGAGKRVLTCILNHFVSSRAEVPFLLPYTEVITDLQDVCVKQFRTIVVRGRDELQQRDAFRVITVDGTFKFLMSVQGQPKHGAASSCASRPGIHTVITARSIDGGVFYATAFGSENAVQVVPELAAIPGVFQQTEALGSDRPQDWDIPTTYMALPQLECVFGDAMHLCFAVSTAYGKSMKPAIVTALRAAVEKWCAVGESQWLRGAFFTYRSPDRPLSQVEASFWSKPTFTTATATKYLHDLNPARPFQSRLAYVKTLAAIKVLYATELSRPANDGKTSIGGLLDRAGQWKTIEYLANGARYRIINEIPRDHMVTGTVGNEAAHRTLKSWGYNVYHQTHQRAVRVLKLWEMSEILRHEASFFSPNPRKMQETGTYWLSRVLRKIPDPSCEVQDAPLTSRKGIGQVLRGALRSPTVHHTRKKPAAVLKRPTMKKPSTRTAASTGYVWKRPSTKITFAEGVRQ